jgi:hypothetical protein
MKIMRSINVLNALLLGVIIALAAYILPPLLNVNVSYPLPAPKKTVQAKEEEPPAAQPPSAMEFAVVAEQNAFSPTRKNPAEQKEEKPLPKPEFVLYGTLVTGDTGVAFIEDLKEPHTNVSGRKQRTLRIGGVLSGFTLREVDAEKVVMVRGEEKIEVRVLDSHKKTRETSPAPAPAPAGVQASTPTAQTPASGAQIPPKQRTRPPLRVPDKKLRPPS